MGCGSSAPVQSSHTSPGYPRQPTHQPYGGPAQKPVAPVQPQQHTQTQVIVTNDDPKSNGTLHKPQQHSYDTRQSQPSSAPTHKAADDIPDQTATSSTTAGSNVNQSPPQASESKQEAQVVLQTDEDEEETDIEIKQVEIGPELLTQYLNLERQIRHMENCSHLKNLKATMDELAELNDTIKQLQEHYDRCVQKTQKEKEDVDKVNTPNVKAFLRDKFDAALSKEQEEYLEALNEEEVAKKDLEGITLQRNKIHAELASKKDEATKMFVLYKAQDELLASVFDGKYGSDREYELEAELDMLLDRRQRVSVARQKWQGARLLINHAATQLSTSVKSWLAMAAVTVNNTRERYRLATEARNNLIAASQNIVSAQRYLNPVQFPYCKLEEVKTLNKAINHIYVDMTSADRFKHALECYSVTYRRTFALVQWFDHVITNTIVKDLEKAKQNVRQKEKELKKERLRLLKAKIAQQHGDFEAPGDEESDEEEDDTEAELQSNELQEADTVSLSSDDGLPTDTACNDPETGEMKTCDSDLPSAEDQTSAPTPLPLNELAPPPSSEDLFGDINSIKQQHEQDLEEIKRAQEVNKARMDQGLQEKLRARRSRRKRQMAREEIEEQAAAKSNRKYINVMKAVMNFSV